MKNKKIISIIAMSSVIAMNGQPIALSVNQKVLTNHSKQATDNDQQSPENTEPNSSDVNMTQGVNDSSTNQTNSKIEDNVITINNVWKQNIGTLKFNPETSKLEFIKGNADVNPYLSKSDEAFSIALYKSNGQLIKSVQVNGSEQPEDILSNALNNLSYSYGDIIKIDYKTSSKISISNFNNQKSYEVNKPIEMEITQNGLKELSSIQVANQTEASAKGEQRQTLNAIVNSNVYNIENNVITLGNHWNQNIGTLKFNSKTSKLEFIEGTAESSPYLSTNKEVFSISLYKSNGQLIKSVQVNGDEVPEFKLNDAFNNLSYSYGDILRIDYKTTSKISISNFDNQKSYEVNKPIQMEITQDGLKELPNNLTVNPIYFTIGSNKTNVSGKTSPNTAVNVWIGGKDYTTTSNSNGEYNLNIEAEKTITSSTQVEVSVKGEQIEFLNPLPNPNVYKIVKNNITLMGNWYDRSYNAGSISFNPEAMKLEVTGDMNKYFANGEGQAFEISLYSNNGSLIKTETYNNNDQTKNLYNDFNGLGFSYGDIIKVSSLGKGQIEVSNYDGKSNYLVNNSTQMTITKDGLVPCNLPQIKVNPFDVLGSGKVTSGTLTGTISKPNCIVNVTVDGKTFTGKSDDKGNFSINISDTDGFTSTTSILVETPDEISTIINPTANTSLGILNSNIAIYSGSKAAQEVSFNPATMTVVASKSCFPTQLIDGKTGAVIASCGAADFTAYTSKDNLNGASFKYGDIISVYETKQAYVTYGASLTLNGKTKINAVGCFKNFRITKDGLVPVENKNLTTSQVLYTGSKNLNLTGKTLPNTNVTISYGDISKVVKSNNSGDFSLEIPFSEATMGSEVRVFVNNQNNENLIVQYDSKLININANRIEVLGDTNLPIFNIGFDPVTNKLSAAPYPAGITYTGAFFENALNIKFINPTNGNIIYSFSGSKLNNISDFTANINGKSYALGDIIEISYNPNLVKANVYNGKTSIGNTDGSKEYFEITNKGLVNLNDKFINVKPLDILSSTKVTSTTIEGQGKPNSSVKVSVDGNTFTGMTNGSGEFSIPISDKDGFTNSTNIVVSSEGYIPTTINPTLESTIGLQNSYINFYNSKGQEGQISSSIGFNPETMEFVVNNYVDSFGNGDSHYFTFDLYNSNGDKLLNASINNGATSAVTNAINNKSFAYGDIIGLSYNSSISKPAILNGSQVLGNVSGAEEYFKIIKEGLVPVNFGQNAYTNNVYWNGNNLVIDSNLADGQNEDILNANKKLVILNSSNEVVDSVSTSELANNSSSVQGTIGESVLDKLTRGESYTFALDINNELFPIKVASNVQSNSKYLLEGNSENILSIAVAEEPVIVINNSSEISNYLNNLNSNIQSQVNSNVNSNTMNNSKLNYEVTANEFISRIGVNNLESFYNKSEANKEFINWVLNNNTAMEEYLEGTNPTININGLQIWSDIWNKYTNSRSGFNLKLAIATAVSNAKPIMAWPSTHYYGYHDTVTVGSPVERYNIFETLNAEGGMLPIFKTLDVKHIEYIVDTDIANSQIIELRSIIMQNHNAYINANNNNDGLYKIDYTIHYNEHNPHTGQSVFSNSDFYGPNPTIADVWYDGGVCYSIAKLGAAACQVFGMPAQAVIQNKGVHEVFLYYTNNKEWNIGNNIYGLSKTYGGDLSGWSNGIATGHNTANYNWLYEEADTPALKESNKYLWLANSDISYQDKMNAINEAIKIQPLNLRAWLDKIALMKTNNNLTAQDYINLSNEIISTFKDYPMPMFDTLLQIKSNILEKGTQEQYNNFVNSISNALNSVTNSDQKPIAQDMLALMPKEELVSGTVPLLNSKIIINNFWNQSLGTLGFNSDNMTMNVVGGDSEVNPYIKGETFSIGLYNKDNQLIKSVTLNGGEHPSTALTNAFNNLNFKYGDKIFIDYKTSSKISITNMGKAGIAASSYNVNKPSVFEITKDGLVYLGGNLNDFVPPTGIVKVSTVYENGSAVQGDKYNYTEKGNLNTLIQNESIPALIGYDIDYVTVNGVKTPVDELPKDYTMGTINIVYHLKAVTVANKDSNKNNSKSNTQNTNKKDTKQQTNKTDNKSNTQHVNKDNNKQNTQHVNKDDNKTNKQQVNTNDIKSNSEDIYWDNNSLVINGNVDLDNKVLAKNTPKEIIIKDSKGDVVASSSTVSVNWYSNNKDNYSGFQGIFTEEQLAKLNPNEEYDVYINVDGKEMPISDSIVLKSNKLYTVEANKGGELTIESNMAKSANENLCTYEAGYFTDFGYVLNGNINEGNTIFSKSDSKVLVIKDAEGNIVDKVNCASVNWYSDNKDNYSGFQGIITNSMLSGLKAGEQYSFELEVSHNGKTYSLPIENTQGYSLNTGVDYNIGTNAKKDLVISKEAQSLTIALGQGTVESGYWQPYGYVMNLKVNIGKDVPKGTKMELISKNEAGQVVSVTPGVDVNWYSNNKDNYDGFQAIITPEQLMKATGKNKLYARITLDGKVYEAPINGDLNVSIGSLDYGIQTINNELYLIKK